MLATIRTKILCLIVCHLKTRASKCSGIVTGLLFSEGSGSSYLRDREEHWLCWFENWVIRKISGPKKDEIIEVGRNYYLKRFMIGIPHEMRSV
jgi:hypothetical protein